MNSIIFVYNADSGLINGLKDLIHKVVSPSTYPCSLCAVTYGLSGMHGEWREFVAQLGRPVEFLHKDELEEQYGINDVPLPAAFTRSDEGRLSPLLDSETLDSLTTLSELKAAVANRIAETN